LGITNTQLVTAVVDGVFAAALASPLKAFFDGTVPTGSTDFTATANAGALATLKLRLVAFFGQAGALGCTDPDFPNYDGDTDMARVHAAMPISNFVFNGFNGAVITVMANAGVAASDLTVARSLLESFRPTICNQADCNGPVTPPPGARFILNVIAKTAAIPNHPWTDGFGLGFRVDGILGKTLNLKVGTTYTFVNQEPACSHPLQLSLSRTGGMGATTALTAPNIVYPNNNILGACQGMPLTFTPTADQNGTMMYYQCGRHTSMGGPIYIYDTTVVDPTYDTTPTSSSEQTSDSSYSSDSNSASDTNMAPSSSASSISVAFAAVAAAVFFLLN
jgi:hypothetical protein